MNDREYAQRGREAAQFLANPLWVEAWEAYRTRLLEIIEATDSAQPEAMMQAKRLLTAGKAARAYLERLVIDGKIAAETIKMDEVRKAAERKWWQRQA